MQCTAIHVPVVDIVAILLYRYVEATGEVVVLLTNPSFKEPPRVVKDIVGMSISPNRSKLYYYVLNLDFD